MRIQWKWIFIGVLLIASVQTQITSAEDGKQKSDASQTSESDDGDDGDDLSQDEEGEIAAASEMDEIEREREPVSESENQVQQVHHNLPAGMEAVDPKELGLSESDVAKYFGNVKQLQTLNLPGSKAQILTVGFDDNEKLNLQNFEQLPIAGLEGADKSVAQSAFKQFQSMYGEGNGTDDRDSLTTLFSRNPKLDVLESLELIPTGSGPSRQHQSSSQKVETIQDEEKRVNQHINDQIEQQQRDAQNDAHAHAQLQYQQNPYQQFMHPNLIPHPMMFMQHPGAFVHPQHQQLFYQFPPGHPGHGHSGMQPQQLIQVSPSPSPPPPHAFMHPQVRLQQMLEQAQQQQKEMPPVLVQPPVPRRPPPPPPLQVRPGHQLVRVRSVPPQFQLAHQPQQLPTPQPQIMHIRPAQPQYVQIRQKGEPRQPQQEQQLVQATQSPLGAEPPAQVQHTHAHYVQYQQHPPQYITQNGQILSQLPIQPTAAPTPAPHELNFAHQSQPLMIIQNPPEMGHTAFLEMYNRENAQRQQIENAQRQQIENAQRQHLEQEHQQQQPLNELNYPASEELVSNSLQGAPGPTLAPAPAPVVQFDPALYAQNQQFLSQYPQLLNYQIPQVPLSPHQFSTLYKQVPVVVPRPSLVEQQIQRPFQLLQGQPERHRPIGTHYRGRHIASIRNPFGGHGPAFGTQPPLVFRGDYRSPHGGPNSYMMAPEPKGLRGFGFGSSTPRPQFSLSNINLQTASQELIPAVLPFLRGGGRSMREPRPSMPMIKISSPENAMRSRGGRKTNKLLEEMIHVVEHKLRST